MTIDDIRTLLYRGVAWYSREQVQMLLDAIPAEPAHGISMDQAQKIARDCGYPPGHELPASLLAVVKQAHGVGGAA